MDYIDKYKCIHELEVTEAAGSFEFTVVIQIISSWSLTRQQTWLMC